MPGNRQIGQAPGHGNCVGDGFHQALSQEPVLDGLEADVRRGENSSVQTHLATKFKVSFCCI